MSNWRSPLILEFAHKFQSEPVAAIERACYNLLQEKGGMRRAPGRPVDISKLAVSAGIRSAFGERRRFLRVAGHPVRSEPHGRFKYANISSPGMINLDASGSPVISLNPSLNRSHYRFRFTIAHELAHFIIRRNVSASVIARNIPEIAKYHYEEEILCQHAASVLLMPVHAIEPLFAHDNLSMELVQDLARRFVVSVSAVINRLAHLVPGAIAVYWKLRNTERSKENTLRVTWSAPHYMIRRTPFVPLDARASDQRFSPNVISRGYYGRRPISESVVVNNFGELRGDYNVLSVPSIQDNGSSSLQLPLFQTPATQRDLFRMCDESKSNFDVISLLIPLSTPAARMVGMETPANCHRAQ